MLHWLLLTKLLLVSVAYLNKQLAAERQVLGKRRLRNPKAMNVKVIGMGGVHQSILRWVRLELKISREDCLVN